MPVMDGITSSVKMIEFMKERGMADVPIVALTACSSVKIKSNCLAAGIKKVFNKPLKMEHMHEMVHRFMNCVPLEEYKAMFQQEWGEEFRENQE